MNIIIINDFMCRRTFMFNLCIVFNSSEVVLNIRLKKIIIKTAMYSVRRRWYIGFMGTYLCLCILQPLYV